MTPAPTTAPPATNTETVTPALQALLDEQDRVVAEVLADPRISRDPEHPLVQEYLKLFVPDATFPTTVVEGWQREADQGRFYQPGPTGVMRRSTVMSVTARSDDDVEFTACIRNSIIVTNESGAVVESRGGVVAGRLNASRVDGVWLLRDLSQIPPDECPRPGEAP